MAWILPTFVNWRGRITDFDLFMYGGRAMLGQILGYHAGLHIYAQHQELQIGPLPLFFAGVLAYVPGWSGEAIWLGLTMACGVITVRQLELVALGLGWTRRAAQIETLLVGLPLLMAWTRLGTFGHLEDAAATALILFAVTAILTHRAWWQPAIAVGLAAMCKPWALAVTPILFQLPRKDWLKAWLTAAFTAVVMWLPFVLADSHTVSALGSLPSRIFPHSTLRLFGFKVGNGAPKGARLMEVVLGAALASWAVIRHRWLAALLIAMAARALLDPRWFLYYAPPFIAGAMVWDLSEGNYVPIWSLSVGVIEMVIQLWAPPIVGVIAQLLLIGAVFLGVVWSARQPKSMAGPPEMGTGHRQLET